MALISAAELDMFRADAKGEMVDTLTIRAVSVEGDFDPETGTRPLILGALRYHGRGKIQDREVQEQQADAGAHGFILIRQEIQIPVGVKVLAGDVVTVDVCPNDPTNVGRVFRVAAPQGKTWATAQRVPVDEVVG